MLAVVLVVLDQSTLIRHLWFLGLPLRLRPSYNFRLRLRGFLWRFFAGFGRFKWCSF